MKSFPVRPSRLLELLEAMVSMLPSPIEELVVEVASDVVAASDVADVAAALALLRPVPNAEKGVKLVPLIAIDNSCQALTSREEPPGSKVRGSCRFGLAVAGRDTGVGVALSGEPPPLDG
jgi:hypothetical protein